MPSILEMIIDSVKTTFEMDCKMICAGAFSLHNPKQFSPAQLFRLDKSAAFKVICAKEGL
jgi:hypothetical protein